MSTQSRSSTTPQPEPFRSKLWIDIPENLSITDLIDSANNPADKIILEDTLSGNTLTSGQLYDQSVAAASYLARVHGFKPGQRTAVISPSCVEYVLALHATWRAGGCACMINHSLVKDEMLYALELCDPDVIFVHQSVENVIPSTWTKKAVRLVIGSTKPGRLPFPPAQSPSTTPPQQPWTLNGGDAKTHCAAVCLSSGTTGKFKAVELSHYNLVALAMQLRADAPDNWRPTQREVFFPPLSHVYGLYVAGTIGPWAGYYVCLMPRFDLEVFCRMNHARQVTLMRLVPAVAKQLAESPVPTRYQFPYLEYFSCSAAPLHPEIAGRLRERFPGVAICQTYGCTELSGPIAQTGVRDNGKAPLISGGSLIANVEIRFLNPDTEQDAGVRGPGEILIRSPVAMMGYKDNAAATQASFIDGDWLRTGDLGYLNENDYLILYDRLKDMIKYKGFQVSPLDLEESILRHAMVDEVCVRGVENFDRTTELPRAYVVLKEPHRTAILRASESEKARVAKDITDFVAAKVSTYKQLRGGVVYLEQLPTNSRGKILRRMLPVDVPAYASEAISAKL